jgi:D-beta-D-heptose 7-phosphate kinase / D-beta-D-heptose 1-phosphate adenosyltransferase
MTIAIIGDVIDDEYWHGKTHRLSPEAPIPVISEVVKSHRLGGAGNVYQNLSNLTDDVFLYDPRSIRPHKLRIFIDNYLITRIDTEVYQPIEVDLSLLPIKTEYCILSDYNKGILHNSQLIIDQLNNKKIRTIVDPKKKFSKYKNCWLLKTNKKEFEEEVNTKFDEADIEKSLKDISLKYNIPNIIITTGGGPLYYYKAVENIVKKFETKVSNVIDVTGAGDVFIAVLTFLVSNEHRIEEAIEIANKAATLSVSKLGTYAITKEDLNDCIHERMF